jgi:predicted amidohydrolase
MRVSVVQTRPVKGDIQKNIDNHKRLIDLAVSYGAQCIIFPELSITGYEPELAEQFAITADDNMFNDFQQISDAKEVTIGIGMPTKAAAGICISMILFLPRKPRQVYSKKYLHADEEPFFSCGENNSTCIGETKIAIAICYELSVPRHSQDAFNKGAEIYLASVAKSAAGIDKAEKTLGEIARKYSMPVLMANCVGPCDNFESAGRSSIWNSQAELLDQLDESSEGILVFDSSSQQVSKIVA